MARRARGGWLAAAVTLAAGTVGAPPAEAQTSTASVAVPAVRGFGPARGFFEAPGFYGTSLGTPSYGMVRANSSFSSPYGAGYAYGYEPYGLLPGRYGVALWKPGFVEPPLYNTGYHSYRTWALPYQPGVAVVTPPIGLYAPGFGPPIDTGR